MIRKKKKLSSFTIYRVVSIFVRNIVLYLMKKCLIRNYSLILYSGKKKKSSKKNRFVSLIFFVSFEFKSGETKKKRFKNESENLLSKNDPPTEMVFSRFSIFTGLTANV